MTDQNHNTPDWNDPNRRHGDAGQANVEGGNQSGGQQPSGQPGQYAAPNTGHPDGQYGQPGEYADPSAHQAEGRYGQPGEYVEPAGGRPAGGQTDQYGQPGQYAQAGQFGQPSSSGQPEFGQPDNFGQPGQFGQPNATGAQQPVFQQGGFDPQQTGQHEPFGSAAPQPPQKERKPRTDENGEPYGVGPFTLRETIVAGLGVLLLIASFLPLLGGQYAEYVGYSNLWGPAPWLAIPGALVFVAASALLVLRRTVPSIRWRVGSLSVDQFASAAAISTAGFHLGAIFLMLGLGVWFGGTAEGFAPGAGPIVGLIASLAGIALTTFAHRIPPFSADFTGRPASEAHPFARAPKNVPQRPKPEPQAQQTWDGGQNQTGSWPATQATDQAAGGNAPQSAQSWPQQQSEPWPGTPAAASAQPSSDGGFSAPDQNIGGGQFSYDGHSGGQAQGAEQPQNAPQDERASSGAGDATPTSAYEPIDEETIHRAPAGHRDPEPVAADDLADEPVVQFAADPAAAEPAAAEQPAMAEPVTSEPEPTPAPAPAFAPYWVLAPENRTVVDLSTGAPLFDVGPTAWALAVGEHDGGLVIRSDDGRVGVLRTIDDLTRG